MKLITTTHTCLRYRKRQEFEAWQVVERQTRFLGFVIWSREIDREGVPSWALIQKATLGSTEWRSRLLNQYEKELA